MVRSYRDLVVWQRAMDLVVEYYRVAKLLPKAEAYGLVSQIRGRPFRFPPYRRGTWARTLGDYLHHLSVANGSLMELETHLLLTERLGYVTVGEIDRALSLSGEAGRMLAGLTTSLKSRTC